MSSIAEIISLASTLSLNDTLVLIAELAHQQLFRQREVALAELGVASASDAESVPAEATAKPEKPKRVMSDEQKAKIKATKAERNAAGVTAYPRFVITESGLAKGLTVHSHVYATSKQAHEAIKVLTAMRDAGVGVSRADILKALEHTDFTAHSKQSAKSLVDYWMKEFNKLEWIKEVIE
jgi:hypothetical protein